MQDAKNLLLIWNMLHLIGTLLFLVSPIKTCIIGTMFGLLWKRQWVIARNIFMFVIWWSVVTIRWYSLGVISTIILFLFSPRIHHEVLGRTLPIHCIWVLNLIYPPPSPNKSEIMDSLTNNKCGEPTISIIVCNKNESLTTLKESIASVMSTKKYAEKKLGIRPIRLVFADGGSKNIEGIRNKYGSLLDLITIIEGGKLRGRHEAALNETSSDIIIAYDSDRKYDIKNAYRHLEGFIRVKDNNKYASCKNKMLPLVGTTHYVNSDGTLPFNGGNSAYLRKAYLKYPFNTTINEARGIWKEEEIDWRNKLARTGSVISVEANYAEIDPIPFMSNLKRAFNLENSFGGGQNRSKIEENFFMIVCKVILIISTTVVVSLVV